MIVIMSFGVARAQTPLLSDSFDDGERALQNLPSSAAWFTRAEPSGVVVRNGALVKKFDADLTWAYFPPTSLKVGESIRVSVDFSLLMDAPVGPGHVRVALCHTNGITPSLADGPPPRGRYQGYAVSDGGIFKRNGPGAIDGSSLLNSVSGSIEQPIWTRLSTRALDVPQSTRATYTFVVTIKREEQDRASVTYTTIGAGIRPTNNTVTVDDPSAPFFEFDTVALLDVFGGSAGEIAFEKVEVVLIAPPTVAKHPAAQFATPGYSANFEVEVGGNPTPAIQWQRRVEGSSTWVDVRDNSTYSGTNTSRLVVNGVTAGMAGDDFRAIVSSSQGSATTEPAKLHLSTARLVNLSILTELPARGDEFTLGYVVGGSGTFGPKSLLVRVAGPSLASVGVSGFVADPVLETFTGPAQTGGNNDWGGAAQLTSAMQAVGAFPFVGPTSRDAAAAVTVTSPDNSVKVAAADGGTGTLLAELYDATPADEQTATTARLVNVSVLKHIGASLTVGFVVAGGPSKTVLVRAVGPTLGAGPFNLPGTVNDPKLELFDGASRAIATNDDWGGTGNLLAAFSRVGAFGLASNQSKDAALLVTVPPGNYTVKVSPAQGASGTALVEVYEVP